METQLNTSSVRTRTGYAFPHVEQVARSVLARVYTPALARRSGHFERNPGCGTLLSYSSSCLEPVYARQVSSRRPLNRPFQVLRACSACMCACHGNTGLEGASLPPPSWQNGTQRFACSFLSLSLSLPFSRGIFRIIDLNDR